MTKANQGKPNPARRPRKPSEAQATKRQRAIEALLQQTTIEKAAETAGVDASTLHRWLKEPGFQEALQTARYERRTMLLGRWQQGENLALNTLARIMADITAPATARVQAAKAWMEQSAKGLAQEEFHQRLMRLEKFGAENPHEVSQ